MTPASARTGLGRAWRFVAEDVWDIELSSLSALTALGVRILRVIHLVFRGFHQDECPLHASALTFSTLMSIVPVLALSLALARGLGDEETAKNRIRSIVSNWTQTFSPPPAVGALPQEIPLEAGSDDEPPDDAQTSAPASELAVRIEQMVESGFEKVENISFKALGGVGLVLLLWMVIQVLGRVESALNKVWGITTGRSLWRKFTDYLSMLFILPVLIVAASSLPVADFATRFLDPEKARVVESLVDSAGLKLLTVMGMTTVTFMLLIMFMPNTTVKFRAALAGGMVGSLLFLAWLRLCAALQVGAGRYGRIYGSFAVVPIVLAWVYISWQIVLFAAEVAFAVQNCTTYRMEQGARRANVQSRILLALSVVLDAARAMVMKSDGFEVNACARERRVPVRFLNEIVGVLVEDGLLAELSERTGRYVLLRAPEQLEVREVADAIVRSGVGPADLGLAGVDPRVRGIAGKMSDGMSDALQGATVGDLLKGEGPVQGDGRPDR